MKSGGSGGGGRGRQQLWCLVLQQLNSFEFRICSSEQGLCFDFNDDDDDDQYDGNDDADDDEHLNEVHCSLQAGNLRSKQAALRGSSR